MWITKIFRTKKEDVSLFRSVITFHSILGVFPLNQKYRWIILTSHLIGIACFSKANIDFSYAQTVSFNGVLLFNLSILAMVLFSLTCLIDACSHEIPLKKFFSYVNTFDIKDDVKRRLVYEYAYKWYLTFAIATIFYAAIHTSSYTSSVEHVSCISLISIIYVFVMSLQVLVTTLVLKMIFWMLEKRYDFLKEKTGEVYSISNEAHKLWDGQQLKDSHLLLINTTGMVNKLFGHKILMLMILVFLNVLGGFQYVLLEPVSFQAKDLEIPFSIGAQIFLFLVSIYFFVD